MNIVSKALILAGAVFASNAFAMEASYDCVRAKSERFCNPCKEVRIPKCCDREATCPSCPRWNYCERTYEKSCVTPCSPCANRD